MKVTSFAIALPVEPAEWVHVLMTGAWKGHHQGPLTITPQDLRDIVANFRAGWRSPVPFDYNHQLLFARENGQPAPASAWGYELELRAEDTELWVRTEWTPRADGGIRGQEWKYVSSVPVWGAKDPKTGARLGCVLHSVALTNTPFLRELPAVALSELFANPLEFCMDFRLLLLSCLCLPTTATDDQIAAAAAENQQGRKRLSTALGLAESAPLSEIESTLHARALAHDVGRFVLDHVKPAGATKEAVLASLQPTLDHAGFVPASEVTALRAELGRTKAGDLVTRALSEGKVVPATESWFRAYAERDPGAATAWLATAPKVFPGPADNRPTSGNAVTLSEDEARVAKALNLKPEKYITGRTERS